VGSGNDAADWPWATAVAREVAAPPLKLEDYATPYDLGDGMLDEFEEGAAAEPLCDGLLGHHGMEPEDW